MSWSSHREAEGNGSSSDEGCIEQYSVHTRAPTSLGLHLAKRGEGSGASVSHARAVGNLVEAVRRSHGPDADGFEEDIESGIARHFFLRGGPEVRTVREGVG